MAVDDISLSLQSCAKNPWVPLDGTPIYGVRPEETRAAASYPETGSLQPQQYADSPVEPSIYAPTVKGVQEISQQSIASNEAQAEPAFVPEPVQDIRQDVPVNVVPAEPQAPAVQQDPTVSYFIPAPDAAPSAGVEDSLLLAQPESTAVPFIPAPAQPQEDSSLLVTAPPSDFSYSTFNADQPAVPVQVPLGVQEQIQEQQASILSNFDDAGSSPSGEGPQQVAVFFSAPAQQVVNTPTLEYLPPHSA